MAGNIGPTHAATRWRDAARDTLRDACPRSGCSSCRASSSTASHGFEPTPRRVLNVTQDHLDWHGTMAPTPRPRRASSASARSMVVNRDDPAVDGAGAAAGAGADEQGPAAKVDRAPRRRASALDAPRAAGRLRPRRSRTAWPGWCARCEADETLKRASDERRRIAPAAPDAGRRAAHPRPPQRRQRARRAGAGHARSAARWRRCCTACANTAASRTASSSSRSVDGVEYFDDSKGTNVGATVAALDGLGADRAPAKLVVILGGDGKGQDFAPLAAPVARHARAVAD